MNRAGFATVSDDPRHTQFFHIFLRPGLPGEGPGEGCLGVFAVREAEQNQTTKTRRNAKNRTCFSSRTGNKCCGGGGRNQRCGSGASALPRSCKTWRRQL